MSVDCKPIEDNADRIVCESCSIEFENVEQLDQHTHDVHNANDNNEQNRIVTCAKCQLEFSEIQEFLKHLQSVHLKDDNCVDNELHIELVNDGKCETLSLETTSTDESVQIGNGIPEQITIINDNGEPIGIADCEEDSVETISVAQESAPNLVSVSSHIPTYTTFQNDVCRKRRLPAKFRDMLTVPAQSWKRIAVDSSLNNSEKNKKDELEIDVSGLTGIRLKTKTNYHEEDIVSYLSRVEEKLDCIIKHFNVPLNTDNTPRVTPFSTLLSKSSFRKTLPQRSLSNDSSIVDNITAPLNVATSRHATTNGHSEQDVSYISCDSPQPLSEITQYVISDDLLNAVYMKSRNRGNFAKHLVFAAFPIEERLGRNCYGRRGGSVSGPKDPLEHAKLEAVREAVFKKFPALDGDDMESLWKRECVIAIDTALRSEMRTRVLTMQNSIKHEILHNNMKSEMLPTGIKDEMKNGIAMNVTM